MKQCLCKVQPFLALATQRFKSSWGTVLGLMTSASQPVVVIGCTTISFAWATHFLIPMSKSVLVFSFFFLASQQGFLPWWLIRPLGPAMPMWISSLHSRHLIVKDVSYLG